MTIQAELADKLGLLPGEVLLALNDEAAHWHLVPARQGSLVRFMVGGEVYPLGRKRGKRPFYGEHSYNAVTAMYHGLIALREVARR